MIMVIQFENTHKGEHAETKTFLQEHGVFDLAYTPSNVNRLEQYDFHMAADTIEDVRNVIAVMLYYNDRTPAEARRVAKHLALGRVRK